MGAIRSGQPLGRELLRVQPSTQSEILDANGHKKGIETIDAVWQESSLLQAFIDTDDMLGERNQFGPVNNANQCHVQQYFIDVFLYQDSPTADSRLRIWPRAASSTAEPQPFYDVHHFSGLDVIQALRIPAGQCLMQLESFDTGGFGLLEFGFYVRGR